MIAVWMGLSRAPQLVRTFNRDQKGLQAGAHPGGVRQASIDKVRGQLLVGGRQHADPLADLDHEPDAVHAMQAAALVDHGGVDPQARLLHDGLSR